MTIRKLIAELIAKGHDVKWRDRSDGGVLVTEINGKKYEDASGNGEVRRMTGSVLSAKREKQLNKIKRPKNLVSEKFRKNFKELQKQWKKATKKPNETNKQGKLSLRKAKEKIRRGESEEQVIHSAEQAVRKAQGLAYDANIDVLIGRIQMSAAFCGSDEDYLFSIIEHIEKNRSTFKDEWIPKVYEIMYQYDEKSITAQEALRMIKSIVK